MPQSKHSTEAYFERTAKKTDERITVLVKHGTSAVKNDEHVNIGVAS